MSRKTKLGRYVPARLIPDHDKCWSVPVIGPDGEVKFELLIYAISKSEIFTSPNKYVSAALNRRNLPLGYSVSPFLIEEVR